MDFKSILANLNILIRPHYWVKNELVSKSWDREFNKLLDKHDFFYDCEEYAYLGGRTIWIVNHPYASFNGVRPRTGLPSRKTVLKAYKQLRGTIPKKV